MSPVAQRFGEWASTSRTFTAITDLLTVVQREGARLPALFSRPCALPLSSCLPSCVAILSTAATISPTRQNHQTTTDLERWCILPSYATEASQRPLRSSPVTVQAPLTSCSLWHHHNPITVYTLRESPCFAARPSEHEQCAGNEIAVNAIYAASLRRPLSKDVPNGSNTFWEISHFRNSLLDSVDHSGNYC